DRRRRRIDRARGSERLARCIAARARRAECAAGRFCEGRKRLETDLGGVRARETSRADVDGCGSPCVGWVSFSIGKSMSSATLAIVDDDQPFADYLQTMLKSRGYETLSYQ